MTTEADARIIVDRLLKEAGWDLEDKRQVLTEESAAGGDADYVLLDRRGRPLAVVEAKRFSKDPYSARQQALDYAKGLKAPFIFLSNGESTYFWDYEVADARQVAAFFTRNDLERIAILRTFRRPLGALPVPDVVLVQGEEKQIRPYQRECIQTIGNAIEAGKRRLLIEMATATGKTLTIAVALKRLFQAGIAQRVLFLADRIELARQAKEDVFDEYLKDYPSVLLYGGRRSREGQIVVGTLATIDSQRDLAGFSAGYFDVVVTDECHRSIYSGYRETLLYFDAIHIGLTATPNLGFIQWLNEREYLLVRNTYDFFDCWNPLEQRGEPTFHYGLEEGIRDGFLADYDVYLARTRITVEGVEWQGEDYDPLDLERIVTSEDRNFLMVKEFREVGEKQGGDHPRKTIVFAVSKRHASQLCRFFNEVYPEYRGAYAQEIHTDVRDPQRVIRRFKREPLPVIAVSVGMLDTGFDYPDVENLVMMRPTRSYILYQQMRGRGHRLSPKIGKTSFLVYDFVGNSLLFENPARIRNKPEELRVGAGRIEKRGPVEDYEPKPKRELVLIPRGSVQDEFVERRWVEVGPQGEKVETRSYREQFEERVRELVHTHSVVARIRDCPEEVTEAELVELEERLNQPEFYFNEANLREAYRQPLVSFFDFVRAALGLFQLPTREERVSRAFDAWLIQKNFTPEQARLLRMLKNQVLAGREVTVATFNQPPFTQFGGLPAAVRVFGEEDLQRTLEELKVGVLV
jgi:type I restriction enzyme R subunit